MRDNRIRQLDTAKDLANKFRRYPIFVFKSDGAKAVFVFGRLVYASKAWNGLTWWQKFKINRKNYK